MSIAFPGVASLRFLILGALAVACVCDSTAVAGDRVRVRIDRLEAQREGDGVRVSFALANGLTDEILERIHSGVPVTFRHKVEILVRRSVPLWFSRVAARARVDTSVSYDSLTRQYALTRVTSVRHAGQGSAADPVEQSDRTESIDRMRSWLTELTEIPPIDVEALSGDARLRVRVESSLGRRYVMFLFPARQTVTAELKLES